MSEREFDIVVVGAGPAGEVAIGRCADAGLSVAVVEDDLVGGECAFWACMPSKALLRPAELLAETKRVPGVASGDLDVRAVLDRRDDVIAHGDDSRQVAWLEKKGIELFRGHGRLAGERRVRVGDTTLVARRAVVLDPGTGDKFPPIDGLGEAGAWGNRTATTAEEVPNRLAIIGGGVVGSEMTNAWRALGAQVTLIETSDRPLPSEERFAGELVLDAMRERGIHVLCDAQAVGVHRHDDGTVTIDVKGRAPVLADELIVATGRKPHTDDLGLETIGLEPEGFVAVDDQMRATGVDGDWLYAVGDVNGRVLLTHMGKYQARVAIDAILGGSQTVDWDGAISPRVTFTDPQVAAVGYTFEGARGAGLNVRAVDREISRNAGASFVGRNTPSHARLVVDEDRKVIVGATFVGFEVQDFLHAATIAMVGEVPMDRLSHAIPAFPTRSEVWLDLLEAYGY